MTNGPTVEVAEASKRVLRKAVARALTIAGSDSGGGAGIQADLKTFAALRVHGMSAMTAITAQNTTEVRTVHDVPVDIIKAQIEAVIDDVGVDAAKTGMLHTTEIIRAVAEEIKQHRITTVVDPVMIAKSGAKLLQEMAIKSLKEDLLPAAAVVTPNAMEAEVLAQMGIHNLDDAKVAAKRIAELGPRAVIVKGGHIPTDDKVTDTLYFEDGFQDFQAPYVKRDTDHGTGCSFSAAITAELAKGNTIANAVGVARMLISSAIRHGIEVGKGHGPVNPLSLLYREAERSEVLDDLNQAIVLLEDSGLFSQLIPESQSNIGMSLREPESPLDVAAVPGRIVKIGDRVKASASPQFGASKHVAAAILAAVRHDPSIRAAINIRYEPNLVRICERLGLTLSSYDRSLEPAEVKEREGGTIPWGTEQAIKKMGRVPDLVYHTGDYGKEPMAVILGKSAREIAGTALKIAEAFIER
jgi:hydroxymethylpyrimidine kinase/phosphomethylpyrimidine kinase